ncbi:putative glycoprotease family protein [Rosellinia necatrix]|uniref:Putative glycoprotease family protein n=1 Tax=Rosellinia necatrix TaxID=77044 RepID=A0A1W2TBA0_ROSNE|nr:putative glycoprotease family protein [Rosellinia necatrix]
MNTLWKSSRQHLHRGSQFPPTPSPATRRLPPFSCSSAAHLPRPRLARLPPRRPLLTLAIETSCDDTCVAILEKSAATGAARLHFNERITSDNRAFGGVHPLTAVASHTEHIAPLVRRALRALPKADGDGGNGGVGDGGGDDHGKNGKKSSLFVDGSLRSKPDFVSVTRGPGMTSNLATGLNVAKGLAVAWDVPLLAVNHMQAHALTPRLVAALRDGQGGRAAEDPTNGGGGGGGGGGDGETGSPARQHHHPHPRFPFLSLLVSGGHTMLVRSQSLNDHVILADTSNIAVGDMLDKCARMILPSSSSPSSSSDPGMYGPQFEEFAFPGSSESAPFDYDYAYAPPASRPDEIKPLELGHDIVLTPPLSRMGKGPVAASTYEFAGLNGQVQKVMHARPDMDVDMRRALARATMTLVFEHLVTRVLFALRADRAASARETAGGLGEGAIKTLVLSGGVASNRFLRHVVREMLDVRGYADVEVVAPPVSLCTDNAAMIAWTAMEMYEEGWRSDLDILVMRKWPLDPNAEGGGILGASGWYKASETLKIDS